LIYLIRRQKLQKDLDKIKEETEMQIAAMEGKIIPKSLKQNDVIIFLLLEDNLSRIQIGGKSITKLRRNSKK